MPARKPPVSAASRRPDAASLPPPSAGTAGHRFSPLDSVDATFRALTTGPVPLAISPGQFAPGLPRQMVPLDELKALLLQPGVPATARNKVWAELVRRARTDSAVWVIGLTGVAMPGLRRAEARLVQAIRHGQLSDAGLL